MIGKDKRVGICLRNKIKITTKSQKKLVERSWMILNLVKGIYEKLFCYSLSSISLEKTLYIRLRIIKNVTKKLKSNV